MMDDAERLKTLYRCIEAHRWVFLALTSSLIESGAMDVRSFIADLRRLEGDMRKRNEADAIIGEIGTVARLLDSLNAPGPATQA